jgi:hypothetical protein
MKFRTVNIFRLQITNHSLQFVSGGHEEQINEEKYDNLKTFIWLLVPCTVTCRCQHFRATDCLHLPPCRWRQYVSLKPWHILTSLQSTKTQKHTIIMTAMKTSTTTCKKLVITVGMLQPWRQNSQGPNPVEMLDFSPPKGPLKPLYEEFMETV